MRTSYPRHSVAFVIVLWCLLTNQAHGQDVEPRRWTPLPVGINVIGAGYLNSSGDISFDPVLLIEDGTVDMHTLVLSYARTFALFGRSARFDTIVPLQQGTWKGLLDGEPARVTRDGLGDPHFRLSVNLVGSPALGMDEFRRRAAAQPVNTVVGAAIAVSVPLGDYLEDKLLNLGQNRFVIRPQIGVLHTRGKWSFELTGSTFFYTDNDDFFGGNSLEQDPLLALQAHVVRVFKPGVWASLSGAHGWNGESTVNNVPKNNDKSNTLAALSVGFPITRSQNIKLVYLRTRSGRVTGADLDTLGVAWSTRF